MRILLTGLLLTIALHGAGLPYQDRGFPIEARVEDLLKRLTSDEKVALLGGDETGFNAAGIARLGIPPIRMTDGPVGVRTGNATAYPAAICLAASWDTELVHEYGVALAEEVRGKGKNCILGPCVDINRFPLGGRNFESLGEDPFLSGRLAVAYVKGVQSQGVIATVKHFACNDQEWQRNDYSVVVDERTLREIHLPVFEAAVREGGAFAVMSAYNLVNGQHCSENRHLLKDVLKNEWGFTGIVMSDWTSVYSAKDAANNGLDLEMPTPVWFGDPLRKALGDGSVASSVIDDKVRRLLRVRFESGIFDRPTESADESRVKTAAHKAIARRIAEEGIVLAKNDEVLPLRVNDLKSIALIGPSAKVARTGGGGSSHVDGWEAVSAYDGLRALLPGTVSIRFAEGARIDEETPEAVPSRCLRTPDGSQEGLLGEYFSNIDFNGNPAETRVDRTVGFDLPGPGESPSPRLGHENFSIRWTGRFVAPRSGLQRLSLTSDDGSRLYFDGKLVIDNWGMHPAVTKSIELPVVRGTSYNLRIEYMQGGGGAFMQLGWRDPDAASSEPTIAEAVEAARGASAAIVCVGTTASLEGEGVDVDSMKLPGSQAALIRAVAAVNPKTVVVLFGGVPMETKAWIGKVPGVLLAFYPGQEGGDALARILLGLVNPSGKLPFSYLANLTDSPAMAAYKASPVSVPYSEGVFVGYRYYEAHSKPQAFPFGFGLSYTRFKYTFLKVEKRGDNQFVARVKVTNTGSVAGAEIVELYVAPPVSPLPRPLKELKGFAKLRLGAGETGEALIALNGRSFSYYDVKTSSWKITPGSYQVMVGCSSDRILLSDEVKL